MCAVHPPPAAISWLVTLVFWLGSAGVSVLLVVVGLLVPRLTAVRRAAVAPALTWTVCILPGALLGPAAGRPPVSELAGVVAGYPVTQIAVAVAMAATALPYLSRPVHRAVWFLVAVAVLAAVCGGEALPVNAISMTLPSESGFGAEPARAGERASGIARAGLGVTVGAWVSNVLIAAGARRGRCRALRRPRADGRCEGARAGGMASARRGSCGRPRRR